MRKYLLEIRNRLFLVFLTWLSSILISYLYKETLIFLIVQPSKFTNLSWINLKFYFIFTNITEVFSVYVQSILFVSGQVFFFCIMYHFFLFFRPALFQIEDRFYIFLLRISVSVWFFSVIFAYYILIPITWNFFFSFQELAYHQFIQLHFEAKLNEYVNFYMSLFNFCVFYCQIFTIIFFWIGSTNFNITLIRKFRQYYYFFFVFLATLLSPPEIFSQILISLVLIFIYESLLIKVIFCNIVTRVNN